MSLRAFIITAVSLAGVALYLWLGRRRHERHVRAELGMAPDHPESCTRPWRRDEKVLLPLLQAQAWPDCEWVDVIRYRGGAS